jgi:hypothetical protein
MPEVTQEQCFKQHEDVNNKLNDILIKLAELPEKVLEKADKKFASKLTERIVYTMVTIICLGVLTALVSTVVKACF